MMYIRTSSHQPVFLYNPTGDLHVTHDTQLSPPRKLFAKLLSNVYPVDEFRVLLAKIVIHFNLAPVKCLTAHGVKATARGKV